MFVRHQTAGLMGVVANLMQRDQLIWKRTGVLIDILVRETDGIVQIGSLSHWMVTERIQMGRHRIDWCKCGIGGGLGDGLVAAGCR